MSKGAVVHLRDAPLVDPGEFLSERWHTIEVIRLPPGSQRELPAGDIEHATYVLDGEGTLRTASQEIVVSTGVAVTLPKGTSAIYTAGDRTLEIFHVALETAR